MVVRRARSCVLCCTVAALAGCAGGAGQETVLVTSTSFVAAPPAQSSPQQQPPGPEAGASLQELLEAAVHAATAAYGGQLGVATAGEHGPIAAGFTEASPAWSTIKVPIAVAATRSTADLSGDVRAAITVSDNAAAERLYNAVGPEAVDLVLGEVGLAARINTVKVRPEFSTFGQTPLSAADEAVLASFLACVEGAGPVLQLMGHIDPSQRYGLGTTGALFKGGWGPDTTGSYQVRQFGLIPRGAGSWAPVGLTALPADGSYETGQAMLDAAAQQLAASASLLPEARCQP